MVYDWFSFVASRVNIGIWLFDTPYSGRPAISPAMTARLAQIENICGAKIARPLEHYLAVQKLCGDKIVMSSPSETDFLMMIRDHGQRVHQSSASPYLMQTAAWQPMRDYAELALRGQYTEAAAISDTLTPLRAVAKRWLHGRSHDTHVLPIAAIKALVGNAGDGGGPVRDAASADDRAGAADHARRDRSDRPAWRARASRRSRSGRPLPFALRRNATMTYRVARAGIAAACC